MIHIYNTCLYRIYMIIMSLNEDFQNIIIPGPSSLGARKWFRLTGVLIYQPCGWFFPAPENWKVTAEKSCLPICWHSWFFLAVHLHNKTCRVDTHPISDPAWFAAGNFSCRFEKTQATFVGDVSGAAESCMGNGHFWTLNLEIRDGIGVLVEATMTRQNGAGRSLWRSKKMLDERWDQTQWKEDSNPSDSSHQGGWT